MKRIFCGIMLMLLLISMLNLAFILKQVEAGHISDGEVGAEMFSAPMGEDASTGKSKPAGLKELTDGTLDRSRFTDASGCYCSHYDPTSRKIRITYYFPKPKIEEDYVVPFINDGYYHVSVMMDGLPQYVVAGSPVLPFKTVKILLPFGACLEHFMVFAGKKSSLSGSYMVEYGQEPLPLCGVDLADTLTANLPNAMIYGSSEPFPDKLYSDVSVQSKMGYNLLLLNLYPVEYIPKAGGLSYYESIRVEVEVSRENKRETSVSYGYSQRREIVRSIIDNPEVIETYLVPTQTPTHQYVIITNEMLNSTPGPYNFQALRNEKISRNISATIVTVEWIYANYNGTRPDGGEDNQTKIRNFIVDAYSSWGAMYVLLGGDGDGGDVGGESGDIIIPHRGLASVEEEIDYDIPADMYYSCLDGSFDHDGDGIYGEPNDGLGGGEVDLFAEVYVGRACVDSQTEVQNFIRKTLSYQNTTSFNLRKAWMVGEYLGFGGVAEWGGNYKDEIKEGSDAHGYTTVGFENSRYSNRFDVSTLYDRDYPSNNWPLTEIINLINNNVHLINHLGHAGVDYVMKMSNPDVDALTNDELYFIGYSQGCYCGSFDDRSTSPGSYTSYDCISEHFTTEAHGAVAFISNSRYGWGTHGSTDGPSQHYDREFLDAILGENIFNIGIANQDSKEDNAGRVGDWVDRYCYYEINLFGDPELQIKLPPAYEHELDVAVEAPFHLKPEDSTILNATVRNRGLNNETNVELFLFINGTEAMNATIPELVNGTSYMINYTWTPITEGTYNITVYTPPVPGENVTVNNYATKLVIVSYATMIGIIETHGETLHTEELADYYTSLGHIVEKITTTITLGVLDNYDIVIVGESGSDWLSSEIDAAESFIDSGKGFVAIGDQLSASVQEILGSYGISCTGIDAPGGSSSNFDPFHPIMQNVNLIYAGAPINSLQITSPAYWIANDVSDTHTLIAGAEAGGQVLCLSDDFALYTYDDDNEIMLKNIVDWMKVKYEHELVAHVDAAAFLEPGDSSLLNATVYNRGLNNETNVELSLLINGITVANTTIAELVNGTCYTINYTWTPTVEAVYNVTAYVPPVTGENVTGNNVKSLIVLVQVLPDIIIVNDDNGGAWINGTSMQEFESALTTAGYDYWVWNESSMGNPSLDFLTKFQLVIWTCGDYWSWAVDSTDAVTLQAYLAQGGSILLEGEDIGFDHGADSFMVNVAHAIYEVDGTGASGLTVTDQSHPVTAGLPTSFTWQADPPYDDGVSPMNGGAEVIQYTGTTWTAVTVFEGASDGSVVYYAFPLYCLAKSHEETLAINSINWLLGIRYEHELVVALEAPDFLEPGGSSLLNATVYNGGLNNETDVELFLMINGSPVANATISELVNGTCSTVNYLWTPAIEAVYNVTAYASPVVGENVTANNVATKMVDVRPVKGYVLFDQTHGTDSITYYSVWVANLTDRGYVVDSLVTSPIAPSMLEGYDIFVIPQAYGYYSSDELSAIQQFVSNGGGLLVIGDDAPNIYTDLTSFTGIDWISGGTSGVTFDIAPHPVTENVSSVYLDAPMAEMLVTAPAIDLVRDPAGGIMLAVYELVGRVIGFADEGSLWDYGIHQEDNLQLANNMIDWLLCQMYSHELVVTLETPIFLEPGESVLLNATVYNRGLNNETDVELFLFINGSPVANETISKLVNGTCHTINHTWTPTVEGIYNLTAYAPPVLGENVTANNIMSVFVNVQYLEVALFKNVDPWDYHANEEALSLYGIAYAVFSSSDFGLVDLSSFSKVVIASDQDQAFYNAMDAYKWWFEDYVSSGGVLEIHAADWGWHGGQWVATLPGGLEWVHYASDYVTIVDPTHPIVTTPNPITDTELDGWSASVHGYFSAYPAYSRIVMTEDSIGYPAYLEFKYGSGFIVASSQTLEWAYMHQYSLILENSLLYTPIKYQHELAVTLDAPGFLEPGDSSLLNATVYNHGLNNETDVELFLYVNGSPVANETISKLVNGTCHTINYLWTPLVEAVYNVTAYAPPVAGENITANNVVGKMVYVRYIDVALISDYSELLAITGILNSMGIGYDIYNGNRMYLYTENLSLLLNYPTVIFYQFNRLITSGEHSALQSYLSSGGNLLITGYDSLGSPSDTLLADVVRSSSTGDNVGEPDLYVVGASHPIMSGSYGSFPVGYHISGLYSDCDAVEADVGRNAVTVAELADGYDKIIAADLSPGKVVYWNGVGPDDWTTNVDCEAMFKNTLAWFLVQYEHELVVDVNAPDLLLPGDSWLLSATVCNRGLNNETNVELFLIISDVLRWNETIDELLVGACFTINYLWTPPVEAVYNVTAYAPPVSSENVTTNNVITRLVHVRSLQSNQPVVYVNPHIVTAVTGETFTVTVNLFNVTEPLGNLYGFDIKFAWNPAIIEYVNHTITVPVEQYPDGVLHEPILPIMETVESNHVWFAYASMQPAEPFNNPNKSNSIFLITFKVVGEGTSKLRFTQLYLANVNAQPIVHSCIDGLVTAAPPTGHDVAVLNVSSCADTVYTGTTVNITVLAANEGLATETFNITLYANSTIIGVQTITLHRGENNTLTFSWNTTGLAPCSNFTILAKASQVPFETNIINNICFDGWIRIKMLGDLNGDNIINIYDIVLAAAAYNSQPGDPNWNPEADIAQPYQHINIFDIVTISSKYGQTP